MRVLYSLWCAVALLCCSLESFRILQSTSYRPQRGYFKVFGTGYFAGMVLTAIFSIFWMAYFPFEPILCGVYTAVSLPIVFVPRKSPLKFTKRIWRMVATCFLLLAVVCWFFLYAWVLFLPLFVLLSWAITLPIERLIARKYLKLASTKVKNSNIQIIAITGSYGKTSTKDMLSSLLVGAVSAPGSCNTPLGIAQFVNSTDLSKDKYNYLVLEFGARRRGDIAQLCRLFPPSVGIVTGVCPQHMSTFKTFENLLATKCELVENLPENGFCMLCDKSVEGFECFGVCKKYTKNNFKVSNLAPSLNGLDFVLSYGKKFTQVHLPQVTPYSAQTFADCAFVCAKLGQKFDTTCARSAFVRQTPHRMEISHNGNFYIIDDSYNGSIRGVEGACAFLNSLSCTKIVISQGIVECGKDQQQLNERCGQLLAVSCDVVILLGKNSKSLSRGCKMKGKAPILAVNLKNAVKIAQKYITRDCVLMFQNDLPDVANI